jgi:hypothetical protein
MSDLPTLMKHTHRGTCQACGRPTAMQLRNDKLAKHGYTVEWGFFNGICFGSEAQPLEVDKTITEKVIAELTERAIEAEKLAADIEAGKVELQFYKRGKYNAQTGKNEKIACRRDELMPWDADQQVRSAVCNAQSQARHMRSHVSMLQKLIAERHGKPLIAVNAKHELSVGDRVQIGGKKGKLCEVVELKQQVARGCGPYMNGRLMLHAILKRIDGDGSFTFAVPVRTIRQSAIVKGEAS